MVPDPAPNARSTGLSETGHVRSSNQDAILVDEPSRLWLVADGMGGHAGGAEASRLARATVKAAIAGGVSLHGAILSAHEAIRAEQSAAPELADMGTTIVGLHESGEEYEIAWVGDSRAYLFDPDGRLRLLTRDHNLAGLLVQSGALSEAAAASHPKRHVLTDCLGLHGERNPRIDCLGRRWSAGQIILLCSDGLTGEVSDAQLAEVLASGGSLGEMADRLMALALAAGARDNVSLVLVRSPLTVTSPPDEGPWRRWLSRARGRD